MRHPFTTAVAIAVALSGLENHPGLCEDSEKDGDDSN
jgi:hypothetical protein